MAGRRKKVTAKVIEKVLASIRVGNTEKFSCMRAGISYESFRLWRNQSPKNEERVQEALEEWCNALLTKIDEHGKKDPRVLQWRLERMFPERFSRPETQIAIAQINGDAARAAQQNANVSIWTQSPAGLSEVEFQDADWEAPDYQPPALLAPQQQPHQQPVPEPYHPTSPQLRAHESRKADAAGHAAQPIEIEVMEPAMEEYQRSLNNSADVGSVGDRLREMSKSQTRIVGQAIRPTPLPSQGFNDFGERPMIQG